MRQNLKLFSVGLSLLIAVGCSDVSTSPRTDASRSLKPSASAPSFDFSGNGTYSFGDWRSQFVVSPSGGSFNVAGGLYVINFPAGSICDPDLSTYGEGQWDASCVPLNRSITISSTVRLTSNGLAVDFQPDLRFVPSQQVTFGTDLFAPVIRANRDFFAAHPETLRPLAMYYSPFLGSVRVADYVTDPTLVTHVNLNTGRVWRRVKHFSGYMAGTGEPCDPSPDNLDCIEVDGRDQ